MDTFPKAIRFAKRVVMRILCLVGFLMFSIGIVYLWRLILRPDRTDMDRDLFPGVRYTRIVWDDPRPIQFHVVEIDTSVNRIKEILPTPPNNTGGMEHIAQITSRFARSQDADIAINGSFFSPFRANGPLDYYPHIGNPVHIYSAAVYDGQMYFEPEETGNRDIVCWANHKLQLVADGELLDGVTHAIPGGIALILDGIPQKKSPRRMKVVAPRTALGWNQDQTKVWLITVDGRQPKYSEGINIYELMDFLDELGAYEAINMDGGGSSTLVAKVNGKHQILNAPFHTRIPMRERPVANHIGLRLEKR